MTKTDFELIMDPAWINLKMNVESLVFIQTRKC